jgi:hypothetical protein
MSTNSISSDVDFLLSIEFWKNFKLMSSLPFVQLYEVFINKRMTYPQNLKFQDLTAHLHCISISNHVNPNLMM